MAQTNINIRMDEDLKREFEKFCSDVGMTMTTAMCVFAKATVRNHKIPFEISSIAEDDYDPIRSKGLAAFYELRRQAAENGTQDMTLDEINEEIRKSRDGEE